MIYQLSGFSDKPKQKITFPLEDGSTVDLYLEFRSQQLGWFFNLVSGAFTLNGQRLTLHPNILRSFHQIIPFGLSVTSTQPYEPQTVTALSDGTVTMYLLTGDSVTSMEDWIEA